MGAFEAIVAHRCDYTGADLQPVHDRYLALNLESDPLAPGPWDAVVMLGVLEYIYEPKAALRKAFATTNKLVLSYCFATTPAADAARQERGWVCSLSEDELISQAEMNGFRLVTAVQFNSAEDFEQKIEVFARND